MKDAPDILPAAKFRTKPPVRPAVREDLIKKYVFLDGDIVAHSHQPVTVLLQEQVMKVADEERRQHLREMVREGLCPGPRFIFVPHEGHP